MKGRKMFLSGSRARFVFSVLLIPVSVYSQRVADTHLGNWTMFFGQAQLNKKWAIHAEMQFRDYGVFNQPEQILLRTGGVLHFNPFSNLTVGYARITNYSYDGDWLQSPVISEHRFWQQFVMKNSVGRFFFEHRYRLEQRWIQTGQTTLYRDRIRYLVRVTVPLSKKEVEKNTLFLSFYNELFIHFSSVPFDRNRLYGAIGYQFLPNTNFQLGYMAQTVGVTTRSYLQLTLNYNFDLQKKENK